MTITDTSSATVYREPNVNNIFEKYCRAYYVWKPHQSWDQSDSD